MGGSVGASAVLGGEEEVRLGGGGRGRCLDGMGGRGNGGRRGVGFREGFSMHGHGVERERGEGYGVSAQFQVIDFDVCAFEYPYNSMLGHSTELKFNIMILCVRCYLRRLSLLFSVMR